MNEDCKFPVEMLFRMYNRTSMLWRRSLLCQDRKKESVTDGIVWNQMMISLKKTSSEKAIKDGLKLRMDLHSPGPRPEMRVLVVSWRSYYVKYEMWISLHTTHRKQQLGLVERLLAEWTERIATTWFIKHHHATINASFSCHRLRLTKTTEFATMIGWWNT